MRTPLPRAGFHVQPHLNQVLIATSPYFSKYSLNNCPLLFSTSGSASPMDGDDTVPTRLVLSINSCSRPFFKDHLRVTFLNASQKIDLSTSLASSHGAWPSNGPRGARHSCTQWVVRSDRTATNKASPNNTQTPSTTKITESQFW